MPTIVLRGTHLWVVKRSLVQGFKAEGVEVQKLPQC